MPNNEADLRITAIGDRYGYGFWCRTARTISARSGSGRLDFQRPVPEEPLRYCLRLNRELGFDSMAYDILFRDGQFVISEMSYAYLDSAIYRAGGYYDLHADGQLEFVPGHVWPQTLWVAWALDKADRIKSQAAPA